MPAFEGLLWFLTTPNVGGTGCLSRARLLFIIILPGNAQRREGMTASLPEYSTHIYEMMARLGLEPGAGVLPQLSLRYATAPDAVFSPGSIVTELLGLRSADGVMWRVAAEADYQNRASQLRPSGNLCKSRS